MVSNQNFDAGVFRPLVAGRSKKKTQILEGSMILSIFPKPWGAIKISKTLVSRPDVSPNSLQTFFSNKNSSNF